MSFLSDLLGTAYKEGMTEEEISKAIEAVKKNDEAELNRYKAAVSKANSEAAEYKRQLREKQTEDEAKKSEEKEALDKIMKENAELRKSISVAGNKSKLIAMGYEEELANETALAMEEGNMAKVMENQKKYLETQKKVIEADLLKKTPKPNGGDNNDQSMDYSKLIEQAQANGNMAEYAYYVRLQEESKENE